MKVCFSGTFNVLHKGHKHLIDKAYEIAGKRGTVYIGVTKDEMIKKKAFFKPLNQRKKAIQDYISSKRYDSNSVIKPINDKYDEAAYGDFDVIIVSPGTIENAKKINKKRIKNGKKPLRIVKISYVKAEDNKPISSTRILKKEIDENGRILN